MRRLVVPGLLLLSVLVSAIGVRPLLRERELPPPETQSAAREWPLSELAPSAEDPVRLVVMLASGWNTSGGETPGASWQPVVQALTDLGEERVAAVPYSYVGAGHYTACDTNQPVARSAVMMQLQAVMAMDLYPRARLLVAGHSLGGVVATYWLARTLPASSVDDALRARLADSSVVTLDSPVRGLTWAETDDALLGGRVAEAVSASNCASAIPSELDPDSDLVRALADAQPFSNYYNIASVDDRLISSASALLGDDPARVLKVSAGDGGCAKKLWTGGYLRDPLHPISNTAKCWMESHGAVLGDSDALAWVESVARLQLLAAVP